MNYSVRNLKWATPDNSAILLELELDSGEWIPMGVSASYDTQFGRDLFETVKTFPNISPYTPPAPQPQVPITPPSYVTRRQFLRGLLAWNILDEVDAYVAASGNRELQIDYANASVFEFSNPSIDLVLTALGKTVNDKIQFFIEASKL